MAGHIWKILRCEISGVRARSTMGKTGLFPRKRIINRRRRRIGREKYINERSSASRFYFLEIYLLIAVMIIYKQFSFSQCPSLLRILLSIMLETNIHNGER